MQSKDRTCDGRLDDHFHFHGRQDDQWLALFHFVAGFHSEIDDGAGPRRPDRSFHAFFGFRVDVRLLGGRFVSEEDGHELAVEFEKHFAVPSLHSSPTLGPVRKMRVANLSTGPYLLQNSRNSLHTDGYMAADMTSTSRT